MRVRGQLSGYGDGCRVRGQCICDPDHNARARDERVSRGERRLWPTAGLVMAVVALALLPGCKRSPRELLIVRGGPSLEAVFADLAREFERHHPSAQMAINFTCPPCVALRRPGETLEMDVFASLGQFELDRLTETGNIRFLSTTVVGTTVLTLVTSDRVSARVTSLADLHRVPLRRVGVGDPDTVGVGFYARQAMQKAGLWQELEDRLVFSQSGCELLKWLSLGHDIDAAIVLSVCLSHKTRSVFKVQELPAELAAPVPLLLGITASARNPQLARRFVDFVSGPTGREILERYSVVPVSPP